MTAKPISRTLPRWLSALLIGAVLLMLAFMAWSLISSKRRVSAEHRRNFHVLTVLAEGVASWPPTLKTMARANLMLSQLLPSEPREALHGWQARADLYNPRLGQVRIHYAIIGGGGRTQHCPAGADQAQPFSRGGDMTISGTLPLSDILIYDLKRAGRPQGGKVLSGATDVVALLNTKLKSATSSGLASVSDAWLTKAQLCFRTIVRLSDLVELGTPGMPVASLLIVSADGKVVTQLGSERLPIDTQDELVASKPISQSILNLLSKSDDKPLTTGRSGAMENDGTEKLGPYQVEIAGGAYTAYARPFWIPAGAQAKPERFVAVGLIPRRAISKDMSELPPTTLTSFALALALLLALWPVAKLRLIGGGEAMSRLEIWGVGFGLVAAAALATVTVRFAYDVMKGRNAALWEAQQVAQQAGDRFGGELRRSVDAARRSLGRVLDRTAAGEPVGLDASPIEVADFGGARLVRGKPAQRTRCPDSDVTHPAAFPALESFFVGDAEGEQLAGTSVLVWRRCAGGRPDVATRKYFRQAITGRLLASGITPDPDPKADRYWQHPAGLQWTLSDRYAIDQVRSQADGISKTIIAFEGKPIPPATTGSKPATTGKGKPAQRPPATQEQAAAATSVTVLEAMLAPALPPRLDYMVIDAADPEWPVIFHGDPSRVGLEKLRRELASRTAADAIGRLMPSPSQGAPLEEAKPPPPSGTGKPPDPPFCRAARDSPTVCFTGFYDGHYRLFAGRALPGTPWVLLVHADVPAVDLPATQRVEQALWYLLVIAIVVSLAILIERHVLRLRHRPRLVAVVSALRQRLGLAEHDARAVRRRFILAGFLFLLAFCAIVLDLLLGRLLLTLLVVLPAGLVTFLYLLPIGRRAFSPRMEGGQAEHSLGAVLLALLVLTGVVPAFGVYSDASRFIASRQASQDVGTLSGSLERSFRSRREVLTSFDPTLQNIGDQRGWMDGVCVKPRPANIFVQFGCGTDAASELVSNSWAENVARMIGDVFAPAYVMCDRPGCGGPVPTLALMPPGKAPFGPFFWSALVMLAGALILLIWVAMNSVMRGLFGVGLPLQLMKFPALPLNTDGEVDLRRDNWTMIVRPPLALSRSLAARGIEVDFSSAHPHAIPAPATQEEADCTPIVFTNLEMTMRDPAARQAALATIETITAWHDRLRAEDRPRPPLVMLAELAPLDRLRQAYEREANAADSGGEARPARSHEKMRWSRLLERFHTYFFEAGRHVAPLGFDSLGPAWLAVEEVAFLPEQAIDALLEQPPAPPKPPPGRSYRLRAEEYSLVYSEPVHQWARDLNAPSSEAVFDYLRAMLAEHYEFVWAISSWAERLAMHHLARGRLMNVETASAMGSLIQRGIVVADPLPRLMNRSFSRFVLQTEKPASVREWRNSLGNGAWQSARWPLAGMIGIGLFAIVLLMINAGQTPEALLPIVIAAGPALLQTLGVIRR